MNKRILISASLFHGLNDAATLTVPMVFPLLYSQRFIITKYAHIGILSNLGFLVTIVCHLIVANYAHKYEYKHMLLFSLTGISFSLFLITFSRSLGFFIAFYLVMRAFASFYHSVGVATVSTSHPDRALDFAMGIQSASGNLGVFLAFILAGNLAQNFEWNTPLYLLAGISIFLVFPSFFTVRNISTKTTNQPIPDWNSWKHAFKETLPYFPGFFFGGAAWVTTVFYAPSLLNHRFQIPLGRTGLYLALWIAVGSVMPYLYGYISQQVGRRRIVLSSLFGSTIFLSILGMTSVKILAVMSLVLFGASLFMIYPAMQSFVGERASPQIQTQAFSIVANVQMLAGAIVSLASGFLSDAFGINFPFIFLAALGVGFSVYFILRRTEGILRSTPNIM
ncbi:MAG: MFS transporter [Candidatus Aminicenantes bacterium]|nr:MFS transporter [Candidatus Aminicenantes bacterium]